MTLNHFAKLCGITIVGLSLNYCSTSNKKSNRKSGADTKKYCDDLNHDQHYDLTPGAETFEQDIAPLMQTSCVNCHTHNHQAYATAATVQQSYQNILQRVQDGSMPPRNTGTPTNFNQQQFIQVLNGWANNGFNSNQQGGPTSPYYSSNGTSGSYDAQRDCYYR